VEETKDVVEACSQLYTQDSAFGSMLVVLGIGEHVELQYRQPFTRHP
jgi:hypothetical protein